MNKEQFKGTAKNAAGKVQETTGKILGDKGQQIKGLQKQVSGTAEKTYGDVKQAVKNITKNT